MSRGSAAHTRLASGLPPVLCPQCGRPGRHWVPESLSTPGHFICTRTEGLSK